MNSLSPCNRIERIQSTIQESNMQKGEDVSAAVFLLTAEKYDHSKGFYSIGLEYNISQLSKKHFVFLQILDKWENLGQEIASVRVKIEDRSISVLTLCGHGSSDDRLRLGELFYGVEEVSTQDFQSLAPNATIILNSCNTGLKLAKKIASIAQGRRVIAPTGEIAAETLVFFQIPKNDEYMMASHCTKEGLLIPNMKVFDDNGDITDEISLSFDEIYNVYKERFCWLQERAQDGDKEAQYYLGWHYAEGLGTPLSQKEAFQWFKKAALQGLPEANYILGAFFGSERSTETLPEQTLPCFRYDWNNWNATLRRDPPVQQGIQRPLDEGYIKLSSTLDSIINTGSVPCNSIQMSKGEYIRI